ncbi:MAG: hypothetical protein IKZ49_00445 [Alphaproteobacteria bacterium]|nr:hypothetical protein [Alphaproteobacteria bacterium]
MNKIYKLFFIIPFLFLPLFVMANQDVQFSSSFQTTEEILEQYRNDSTTSCASEIFSRALMEQSGNISENAEEHIVRAWVKDVMHSPDVIEQILQCPELQSISDETTIFFSPIEYEFPNKRKLTINHSTQPKVLKHYLLLSRKRSLPNGDVNPELMNPDDPAKYMNTEPAWYAIMVVQHDSLSEFVGPGKNNTLSVKYINDNIGKIYPKGYFCTSKSAWANDTDTINKVVHEVVDIEDDSNDYYVAGDVNLEWVFYAEIAADIIISVATMGAGHAAMSGLKMARASKTAKNLMKSIKGLTKLDDVKKYMEVARKISQHTDDIAKLEKNIENAKKYEKALKNIENGKDVLKNQEELKNILQAAKEIDPKITEDLLKNADSLKDSQKALKDALKTAEENAAAMEKASDNVKLYKKSTESLSEVMKYRRSMRAWKRPQTGNIATRSLKKMKAGLESFHAANNGAKMMNKAGSVARAGMNSFSQKAGDWLFDNTLKHGARLGCFYRDAGGIYAVMTFMFDMYDKTSSTSKEFSNGIEFKPLCLLSADDLEGQENVVNYGMWLMWVGNSTDPADDDAAYLQAMDFAEKFYYQLDEYQDSHINHCNVDIYVVRPIIRLDETNIDDPKGEMFYLFMNEIPWSTNEQFNKNIGDVKEWERAQKDLETKDPSNKYKKPEQSNNTEQQPVSE